MSKGSENISIPEIEITAEMIEAGTKAHEACDSFSLNDLVREVFAAMLSASRPETMKAGQITLDLRPVNDAFLEVVRCAARLLQR